MVNSKFPRASRMQGDYTILKLFDFAPQFAFLPHVRSFFVGRYTQKVPDAQSVLHRCSRTISEIPRV